MDMPRDASDRPRPPRRGAWGTLVLVAVLGALLWRGLNAVGALRSELATVRWRDVSEGLLQSEEERIRSTMNRLDLTVPDDYEFALYRAVMDEIPEGAALFVYPSEAHIRGMFKHMVALAFPRLVRVLRHAPTAERDEIREDLFVLDFYRTVEEELRPSFQPVAEGPDWVLWH